MADIKIFPEPDKDTPESNFVHLHVHSDYSLLDGASKIGTLIARAKELNMKALALTDHGNMFGVLNFEHMCRANGINPLVGEEFYLAEGSRLEKNKTPYGANYYHLVLIACNVEGYKNLAVLSSIAYTEGIYYKPRIDWPLLEKYHSGIICLSSCLAGELPQALIAGDVPKAEKIAQRYLNLFGKDHYYIEFQNHGIEEQKRIEPLLMQIAQKFGITMVATNDVHYCRKEDAEAQDALLCIGTKTLLSDKNRMKFETDQFYLKSEAEMAEIFPGHPELLTNTLKVASMCNLTIPQYSTQQLKDCLPVFQVPEGFNSQDDYMRHIVEEGLKKRYAVISPEIEQRKEYELKIIFQMGFSGYFLIVWNFIDWAKKHDIPIGPGRGSGAGSLVAYAMSITDIDPFRFKLIFERFLNPERVSMPDFDVDMCFEGRPDIIQYTRDHYGDPQVGHIVTFGTLKAKQVIADVGRVLDIPLAEVNMLKKCIPGDPKATLKDAFTPPTPEHSDNGQLIQYKDDPKYQQLFRLAYKLENINRNTGLHASGIVIGKSPLSDWVPVFKDSKTEKVAVQYTMDIIEPCGLVKMDYLGLKTLTLIKHAEHIIRKRPGLENFKADQISEEDSKTFDLFCRGDTVAVFQFESPGMQKWMKQLKPHSIEELVAMNALYRPGPMEFIQQYIDGKWHPETIHYPDPCLEDILKETYGVMVYQEQVMQVAQRIAGFSLGAADMLRRAMGKKKKDVLMEKKKEFIDGAIKNGFSEQHADEIFEIMVPFAGYGFNKSHAAAYSVVAYRTAYLKANYPAEFIAANLTNEITSTDKLPMYIAEGNSMGLTIDPPDINRSDTVFDVVDGKIVFGLMGIKGLGQKAAEVIVEERAKNGHYKNFLDFLDRVDLKSVNKRALEVLIKTGAFDNLGQNRPTLMQNMEKAVAYAEGKKRGTDNGQASLFGENSEEEFVPFIFEESEDLTKMEKLNQEKELIGCYVSGHPLDDYKKAIKECVTVTSQNIEREAKESMAEKEAYASSASGGNPWQMRNMGKTHTAMGLLMELRTINTKKGEQMAFAKLQDFNGSIDITFFPKTWQSVRGSIETDKIYAFKGKVDGSRDTPSFIVDSMEDPDSLKVRAISEVHIQLESAACTESHIQNLRDFLFGAAGSCCVYFHIDTENGPYIIKANGQITAPSTAEFIQSLESKAGVSEVWTA
ncbi:DNA polymerase III subunit alpha [Treponema parvum]|uniref:DNA polymerase III subunit alpha n=1 Tax=Treponema parvum TaxID=138851 RepID=A0A975F5B5_9SPIR|nr:DNA polymerase III subunit alpha [Treponema parvum]QTQ14741.1 DNA polymerase III subunit alpha [Treponema parvum]